MDATRPGKTRTTSVSLSAEALDRIRAVAGPRGVSGFVQEAVEHELAMIDLDEIVSDYESRHGVISDAEVEAARSELFGNPDAVRPPADAA